VFVVGPAGPTTNTARLVVHLVGDLFEKCRKVLFDANTV